MAVQSRKLYAITIFSCRKEGMEEKDYHDYISKTHAGYLKALLANNDIVSYTMQHNTTESKPMFNTIYGDRFPTESISDCDAVIQIVFKDVEDYLRARQDPHFINVVNPDHANFADPKRTKFAMGWFEEHVADGQVTS
ncbi:hypothetical protein EV356DRAFT_329668 [Viridothelium virens]|uniref:EthD domain-containing protein n=1 Tax=Viridothelium virens TaxID=1048519 RepID=A0A6A6GXM9_VIRVR|nr:hypothetical protein EV356DRAFT_329668 [Viridothelium virens]